MFIENLTLKDFTDFIAQKTKSQKFVIDNLYNFENPTMFKRTKDNVIIKNNYLTLIFSDFDYKTDKTSDLIDCNHDKAWLKFMYEKFGEDYKLAFIKVREQEKLEALKKCERRFDNYTREFLSYFEDQCEE